MKRGDQDHNRPSEGTPAPRECLLQSIERITPQYSFNNAFSVERETPLNRRGFLKWGTLFFSLFSLLGLAKMVQAFLSIGHKESAPTRFPVGRWEEFTPGDVIKKQGVYLIRDDEGLFAIKGDCPHLGCGFHWNAEEELFICPCHGSRFERSGRFISGPAKKPLQHVLLKETPEGEILADVREIVPDDFRLTVSKS